MAQEKKEIMYFKISLLGATEVGKTSLVNQFVNHYFDKVYEPTDNDIREFRKLINISSPEEPQYCLLIIDDIFPTNHEQIEAEDIEGQENDKKKKFIKLLDNEAENIISKDKHKMFLPKQVYGYIFIYDASTQEKLDKSVANVKEIIEYICDKERRNPDQIKTKKMLVGNKIDTLSESQKIQLIKHKVIQQILELEYMPHILASAKENICVQQIFFDITNMIFNDEQIQLKDLDWKKQVGQDETEDQKKKDKKKLKQDDDEEEGQKKPIITKANDPDIDNLLEYKGINVDVCTIF